MCSHSLTHDSIEEGRRHGLTHSRNEEGDGSATLVELGSCPKRRKKPAVGLLLPKTGRVLLLPNLTASEGPSAPSAQVAQPLGLPYPDLTGGLAKMKTPGEAPHFEPSPGRAGTGTRGERGGRRHTSGVGLLNSLFLPSSSSPLLFLPSQ